MSAPEFLNADGRPSMATSFLMIHHAVRRDLRRLAAALTADGRDPARLREAWDAFAGALHAHHVAEDERLFPHLRANPELASVVAELGAEHATIDPILARGKDAFASLGEPASLALAAGVVDELRALLDAHLAKEEARVVPTLRAFPATVPVPDEALAVQMATGWAWTAEGVATDIVALAFEGLPDAVRLRIPAAMEAALATSARLWGALAASEASRTAVPAPLPTGRS